MFSSENSTLVKILDTISLIFRFLSISFLIRSLELIAFSPLGYQLLCWVIHCEKNSSKTVKTALLLSNVIDADHQNSCLFTDKGHFSSPLWVLMAVLAQFHA